MGGSANPEYWRQLHGKFGAIHLEVHEKSSNPNHNPDPTPSPNPAPTPHPTPSPSRQVQEKSKSINKSFGIFNAQTLRHCATNTAQVMGPGLRGQGSGLGPGVRVSANLVAAAQPLTLTAARPLAVAATNTAHDVAGYTPYLLWLYSLWLYSLWLYSLWQDVAGYKSLIARPYESVNRAMPGSYYSDVERTLYLTYYILQA